MNLKKLNIFGLGKKKDKVHRKHVILGDGDEPEDTQHLAHDSASDASQSRTPELSSSTGSMVNDSASTTSESESELQFYATSSDPGLKYTKGVLRASDEHLNNSDFMQSLKYYDRNPHDIDNAPADIAVTLQALQLGKLERMMVLYNQTSKLKFSDERLSDEQQSQFKDWNFCKHSL